MKTWGKIIIALVLLLFGLAHSAIAQDKATESLTLTVNAGSLSFTTTSLPPGQLGLAYTGVSLTVAGGIAPYTFSVSSGSLPAGISLSGAGVFSGTPTTGGTASFTVKVTDSESPAVSVSQAFSIAVQAPLSITTTSLSAANIGVSYSTQLTASGGVSPYIWSISAGALPVGLTLSSSGLISGTPTASGSFSFTIQVVDSATVTPAAVRVIGSSEIKK
jgi:large repetitive protein